MLIRTPRFVLRDFLREDRAAFVAYQSDPRYRRLYDAGEDDGQGAHDLFDLFAAWRREQPRQNFQLGIFEGHSGRLCGCAGLRKAGQPAGTAVLGIELTPDDWGRYRLAIEAAGALAAYGFHDLDLKRIIGDTASGNRRVEKLARWFGADIVAQRKGPEWMAARGWREVDWAISREKWMQNNKLFRGKG